MFFNEWNTLYTLLVALGSATSATAKNENISQQRGSFAENQKLLHTTIINCKKILCKSLSEVQCNLAICALILYRDEVVLTERRASLMTTTQTQTNNTTRYHRLQESYLKISNGGERFFQLLNIMLENPTQYPFALEVFYFCLKQGFQGALIDSPKERTHYIEQCQASILKNARQKNSSPVIADTSDSSVTLEQIPMETRCANTCIQ